MKFAKFLGRFFHFSGVWGGAKECFAPRGCNKIYFPLPECGSGWIVLRKQLTIDIVTEIKNFIRAKSCLVSRDWGV